MNLVIMSGNLTRDPELKYTTTGKAVCEFGLAINEKWRDEGGQDHERVHFFEVVAWNRTAEIVAEHLEKGSRVLIQGKLLQDRWETKEGDKRSRVKVQAFRVEFLGRTRKSKPEPGTEAPTEDPPATDDEVPF